MKFFKEDNCKIYIAIEDELIFDNFKENFQSCGSPNHNFDPYLINDLEIDSLIMSAANLSLYGWKKEAIPFAQTKNSLITRIFKSLFE